LRRIDPFPFPLTPPDTVREQYEAYPYPHRDPEDEKARFLSTWPEQLAQINHYCFGGRQDFRRGFRVLTAGGGTGDATIYLAEQLRDTDAELVYVDESGASLKIAQKRAAVRKLRNIRFIHASLLDLPGRGMDGFDYISCTGVLHHLENPEAGLDALLAVLAPGGAMNLLVYGRYGRAAIYDIQEQVRALGFDGDMAARLERLRELLASLPAAHAWRRHPLCKEPHAIDDAELYDLFLHSRDRPYTVPELHEWLTARKGLHLQFSSLNVGPMGYRPESYPLPEHELQRATGLPVHERAALAERVSGTMDRHIFFVTRHPDAAATPDDLGNVPFFSGGFEKVRGRDVADAVKPGETVRCTDPRTGMVGRLIPGRYTKAIFSQLDGQRSLREMFEGVRGLAKSLSGAGERELLEDFKAAFDVFNSVDGMLLRHRSVPAFPSSEELVKLAYRWQTAPEDMPRA
jgi:SAM-dependent methyltransferase